MAERSAIHNDIVFIKGISIVVLVGELAGRSLWHICSSVEGNMACEEPHTFTQWVRGTTNFYGNPIIRTSNIGPLESLVLVGGLINPGRFGNVSSEFGDLQPSRLERLRCRNVTLNPELCLDRVAAQAQLSFGAQSPQGTIVVGGEAARTWKSTPLASNPCSALSVFSKAMCTQILLFQASTAVLVEQNLFNIVASVIPRVRPTTRIPESARDRIRRIRALVRQLNYLDLDVY
jgi:hypothetical protein